MLETIRPAAALFVTLTLITGALYPAAVTAAARVLFPHQASGSLIMRDGKVIGSRLIGQEFSSPGYFWGRPSATSPSYNGGASAGSNLGPSNPALAELAAGRVALLCAADPGHTAPVPVDLITASGSGLDPHISVAAARFQAGRVARARGLEHETVEALIARLANRPIFPGFGEPCVNVLELNLALDKEKRP